jgi:hypothetical protein
MSVRMAVSGVGSSCRASAAKSRTVQSATAAVLLVVHVAQQPVGFQNAAVVPDQRFQAVVRPAQALARTEPASSR